MADALGVRPRSGVVQLGFKNVVYEEVASALWRVRPGPRRQMTDFLLRVDEIRDGRRIGRVLYDGYEFPFDWPASRDAVVGVAVATASARRAPTCALSGGQLIALAMAFHRPRVSATIG